MRHSLAALGVFALVVSSSLPVGAQTVSLAGTWKLNSAESDNPMGKLEAATSAAPKVNEGYGSMRDRVGAGKIAGEQKGERGGGGARSLPGPDFGRIMKPAASIVIEQNDTLITIRDDQSLPQLLYLDGRKFEEPTAGTGTQTDHGEVEGRKAQRRAEAGGQRNDPGDLHPVSRKAPPGRRRQGDEPGPWQDAGDSAGLRRGDLRGPPATEPAV
jgi:hypothetical protein